MHELPLCPDAAYSKEFLGIIAPDVPDSERYQRTDVLEVFHHDYNSGDARSTLLELKGGLVMYMLDRRLDKGTLQQVLAHHLLEFTSGEMPEGLGTHHFLKQCTKTGGAVADLKEFANQWIFGAGIPCFQFRFQVNRRKQVVEVQMVQFNRSFVAKNPSATRIFSGAFTIRMHEPLGTYDADIQIDDLEQNFELQYHSRSRKVQRGPPGAAKQEPAEPEKPFDPDQEHEESGGIEEDFDWIRLDPDHEWTCTKECAQTPVMWEAQLSKDRDLGAQHEAVRRLAVSDTPLTVEALVRTIRNESVFHAVRAEAARSLATIASSKLPNSRHAFEELLETYRSLFCLSDPDIPDRKYVPKFLEVRDIAAYFVQKGLLAAIAGSKPEGNVLLSEQRTLLLEQLRSRDRRPASFDDSRLLASLVADLVVSILSVEPTEQEPDDEFRASRAAFENLGEDLDDADLRTAFSKSALSGRWQRLFTPEDISLYRDALDEIRQLQAWDLAMPTFQNVLTGACLQSALVGMLAGLYPLDFRPFLTMSRYGNSLGLRCMALDGLILLGGLALPTVSDYILLTISRDAVPYIRYHVARSLAYYALYLARSAEPGMVDMRGISTAGDTSAGVTGLDGGALASLLSRIPRGVVNAAREWLQRDNRFRSSVWVILNDQFAVDIRIRRFLLLFCEVSYEPNQTAVAFAAAHQFKPVTPARVGSPSRHTRAWSPTNPPEPNFLEKGVKMIDTLRDTPWSQGFLYPVVEAYPDIAESYLRIIKHPMDLSTVEEKLRAGRYRNDPRKLDQDIQLIFKNCLTYNQEFSGVYKSAKQLERLYLRNALPSLYTDLGLEMPPWVAAMKQKLDLEAADTDVADSMGGDAALLPQLTELLKRCRTIVNHLSKKTPATWFRNPVDPIRDNAPNYFDIIKHPMDLSTVRKNLDAGVYPTVQAFVQDMRLIFVNAYRYNGKDTLPGRDAVTLEKAFDAYLVQYGLDVHVDPSLAIGGSLEVETFFGGAAVTAGGAPEAAPSPSVGAPVAAMATLEPIQQPTQPPQATGAPPVVSDAREETAFQPFATRVTGSEFVSSTAGVGAGIPPEYSHAAPQQAIASLESNPQYLSATSESPNVAAGIQWAPNFAPEVPTALVSTASNAHPEPLKIKAPKPPRPVKAPPPALTPQEAMGEVLKAVELNESSTFFRVPVRPEDFPDYYIRIKVKSDALGLTFRW